MGRVYYPSFCRGRASVEGDVPMLRTLRRPDGGEIETDSKIVLLDGSSRAVSRTGLIGNVPERCLPELLDRGWTLYGEPYEEWRTRVQWNTRTATIRRAKRA